MFLVLFIMCIELCKILFTLYVQLIFLLYYKINLNFLNKNIYFYLTNSYQLTA